jgi:hypothetical protein
MVFLRGHGFTRETGLVTRLEDENFVASMNENREVLKQSFSFPLALYLQNEKESWGVLTFILARGNVLGGGFIYSLIITTSI